MSEILRLPSENYPAQLLGVENEFEQASETVSVLDGHYHDPDPNIVIWINNRFTDPARHIQATLMKAFEITGTVKTRKEIKEMTAPLEKSGLLPVELNPDELPQYLVDPTQTTDFIDRRDEELLLELEEGNSARNQVLESVERTTLQRLSPDFDEIQERELVHFIRGFAKPGSELPPAYRVLRVMLGIMPPEDCKSVKIPTMPSVTGDMAPDIYWMILREELETRSQATQDVA